MKRIVVIAGPTASGKSAYAMAQAMENNGVIINADSMQIYDALFALTAQPSLQDKEKIAHRLYGLLPPEQTCSAERWRMLAMAEIETAWRQDRLPIVTGGTGLYLNSLIYGLSPVPSVPDTVRAAAIALQRDLGNPGFHAQLELADPVMAARLHPNDTQRLVRAWEVWQATGRSLAAWQALPRAGTPPDWRFDVTLILPPRHTLYARCDRRFDQMIAANVLGEVGNFLSRYGDADLPVTHALGFQPLCDYVDGRLSLDDAITLAKIETRQYAKRQVTWFRHQITPNAKIAALQII